MIAMKYPCWFGIITIEALDTVHVSNVILLGSVVITTGKGQRAEQAAALKQQQKQQQQQQQKKVIVVVWKKINKLIIIITAINKTWAKVTVTTPTQHHQLQ